MWWSRSARRAPMDSKVRRRSSRARRALRSCKGLSMRAPIGWWSADGRGLGMTSRSSTARYLDSEARTLRTDLLAWYARARRDLPWRRTRDPYAVWLSETMLQQTRVDTVIPYYERFLKALPTVAALAE